LRFNIPYYAQTSEFSCGPASVLMVMKHFDPKLKLTRQLEYEVWRQCNMIGIRGADPYGLSVPLLDAGFEVKLTTEWRTVVRRKPWMKRLHRFFSQEEIQLGFLGMKENHRRALERNLPVEYRRPTSRDVLEAVRSDSVPITLVHMGVIHRLNIPHWVVVTDADEEKITFNDPYPPKGRRGLVLSHAKFQKILDDIGTRIGMSPSVVFVRRN